jgi:ribosomal protein L15
MSEEKELTFTFDEDGKEYKVEDLSDENKTLYNKVTLVNKQRQEVIGNANFEVEKLEILAKHYSNALKEAVEGDDTKVEVAK